MSRREKYVLWLGLAFTLLEVSALVRFFQQPVENPDTATEVRRVYDHFQQTTAARDAGP
jgi:hypothetical protein